MARSLDVRVGTTKVRTGCVTCKQRRIKCDESGTPCKQCIKSRRTCGGYASDEKPLRLIQYAPTTATSQHNSANRDLRPERVTLVGGVSSLAKPIGGLRVDPFNALPIENTSDVQLAFDNLFRLQLEHMGEASRANYITVMLNDAMFFETMIAFSKIAWRHHQLPSQRLSKDIRLHIAKVMQRLNTRLPDCENSLNAAITLTIYYLIVVHQAAGEIRACEIHLNGLKQLSQLPPGAGPTGFDGFMHARLKSAELVSKFFMYKRLGITPPDHPHESVYPEKLGFANSSDSSKRHLFPTQPSYPNQPKYLHQSKCPGGQNCSGNSTYPVVQRENNYHESQIPAAFRSFVREGKISPQGIKFLMNIDEYLERPYVDDSKDRITIMLALRMIESAEPSEFPPHLLWFSKDYTRAFPCPNGPLAWDLCPY